ncbi:MAG: hypothetical protein ACFFCZ_18475 [Promethearchaeota archaeon]
MTRPAILFAANPDADHLPDFRQGSISAHIKEIKNRGSVNWNLKRNASLTDDLPDYYYDIRKGYIYYVKDRAVSYKCKINWIKRGDELSEEDYDFTPDWRRLDVDAGWIVLNIGQFSRLKTWSLCSEFTRYPTGSHLTTDYIRNYVIVEE